MKISDKIVLSCTAGLVKLILRPKVYYLDPEKQKNSISQPSILVINHTSHLDGPIVNTVFRNDIIHPLAAKDRFEQKGFGFFLRHTLCVPIDRQNPDLSWIHTSLDLLHNKHENMAIFPEGRHGEHRRQLPFHTGVVLLAAMAQVPIVMVYVDGPFKLFRDRAKLIVAPPFRLEAPEKGMTPEYIQQQADILQEKMKELMNEFMKKDQI